MMLDEGEAEVTAHWPACAGLGPWRSRLGEAWKGRSAAPFRLLPRRPLAESVGAYHSSHSWIKTHQLDWLRTLRGRSRRRPACLNWADGGRKPKVRLVVDCGIEWHRRKSSNWSFCLHRERRHLPALSMHLETSGGLGVPRLFDGAFDIHRSGHQRAAGQRHHPGDDRTRARGAGQSGRTGSRHRGPMADADRARAL